MKKTKIDTKDLLVGMYVSQLDRPWLETPFLFQGFTISSKGDINELERCCRYVYIDEEKSDYKKEELPTAAPAAAENSSKLPQLKVRFPEHTIAVEEEVSEARKIRAVAEQQVSELLNQSRGGKALDIQQANIVVNITQSLVRSPDAMVLLSSIKSHEREAEVHAMNTCILAITLGRFMRLSPKNVDELGMAALLHDVGEVKIPAELLRKEQKTPQEMVLVKRHPEYGAQILVGAKGMPNSVVDVAYSHHEQIDGNGYPRGLSADSISTFTRIVTIVDTYDRLTQGYSEKRIPATEALRYLYLYRDKIFVSAQPGEFLTPKLLLVRDRKKKPFDRPRIMNLATFAQSDPGKYVVKQVLPPDAYGVDMRNYLLSEEFLSA
jgi:HD-GYP domain-containing protein (c-di-GMP phosphodiesterase class II)